ncbi:MAG: gliding motility-associated C-terminal domain-containing protein [Flavobacteriales bacterium]
MRRILLTFLVVTLSVNVYTQSTFRINYDVALFDIPINSTEALTPGNYVFSGFHANFIPFVSSLTEVDPNGTVVWAKRYSGGFAYMFGDFKRDNALNRYYVCGGSDNGPAFLLFLDATGNLISGRNFSISQADGAFFNRVIKTNDGGYLCVGYVIGHDPDGVGPEVKFNPVTNNDASCSQSSTETISSPLVVKFDANGVHQWHRVFRYYVTSNVPANRIYNDASFVDLVEVSDGYVAIGSYDVNNVFSTFNGDCEDTTPTDATFLKLDFSGNIIYHRQIDNPSNSTSQNSKSMVSASKTAAGLPLISAVDNDGGRPTVLMRLPGSGGWANPSWIRRYGAGNFFGSYYPFLPSRFFETNDGNYALWANYIPLGLPPSFDNVLMKINPSTNAAIWARRHTFNFASIFPNGEQVSDGGYIGVSYTLSAGGHDLHFIKTDDQGNAPTTCAAGNLSVSNGGPSYVYGTPIFNSWTNGTVTNNLVTPIITNINPTTNIQCIQTVCIPPSAPTAVTATPNPICAGQSTTITASGGGTGNTYNVYTAPTGGTNLGATPLVVSPGITTTYYVETVSGSDPTCVSTTRTAVTVTVDSAPTVTVIPSAPAICIGGSVSLTASGATTYTWSPSAGLSATTGATVTANPTTTTTYTVEGIAGPGCPGTTTVTVTVNPLPTITATPSAPAICAGNSVSITASGASTYTWSPATGLSGTTGATVTANPGTTTTYTITGTDANGCQNTTTVQVTVNSLPTAAASASPSTVCVGGTINLSSSGGTSYSWTGPNTYSSTTQNPTIINATLAQSGTYTVTVTDGNGCSATANTTVTVSNGATLSATVISNVSCNGGSNGSAQVSPSGTSGPYTYSWSPSGGTGATAQNLSAGTYTVTVTDGNGCQSQESVTVTEPTPINLSISSTASSCVSPTGSATVVASGGAGNFTYIWSPSGGTGATANNIGAGPYTVTVTDGNGCTETASVTVNTVNGPDVVIASSNNASCFGLSDGSATAIASNGTPGYTYSWSPTGGNNAVATGLSAGNYTVEVTDAAGCTAFATVTITQPQQIVITGVVTDATCGILDGAITANAVGGSGTLTYVWQPGNIAGQSISNLSGGTYTVTVSDGACSESAAFNVNVTGSLNIDINPPFSVINQGDVVDLTVTVNPNIAGSTYSWNPTTDLSCSNCPNPTASPNETTTYTVTVTSPDGCTGTASAIITVEMVCGDIFMPTIFSPNDDGLNDELCLLGGCIEKMELSIYNRWGELVFQTDSQDNCWDGTYKGQRMNTAAFVYVLYVKLLNGEEIQQKGNINLVR